MPHNPPRRPLIHPQRPFLLPLPLPLDALNLLKIPPHPPQLPPHSMSLGIDAMKPEVRCSRSYLTLVHQPLKKVPSLSLPSKSPQISQERKLKKRKRREGKGETDKKATTQPYT